MVVEKIGDVFQSRDNLLVHGCNCFHTFGAGVAKKVKEFYPDAYFKDLETKKGDESKLGDFSFWLGKHYYYDQRIIVVNLYSQYYYGRRKVYVNYDALEEGLKKIEFVFSGATISMPRIGAGLAGGNWNNVFDIIHKIFDNSKCKVTIYFLEG